jgi:AcrR family transcriptional regulator
LPAANEKGLAKAVTAIADAVEAEEGKLTAKKRRIIEAALICFAEQGFEATSTAEIAARAGVAEATIFRHFNSKKELLVRLVRPVAGRLLVPAALQELEDIVARTNGDFRQVAKEVMRSRIAFADRHAPLIRIVAQELPFQPELREMLFSDSFLGGLTALAAAMRAMAKSGQLRSDIPPERLLRWFGALIASYYLIRSMLPPQTFDDEEEIDATVDFLMRGAGPGRL